MPVFSKIQNKIFSYEHEVTLPMNLGHWKQVHVQYMYNTSNHES